MTAAEKKTRAGETTITMLAAVVMFLFMPLVVIAGDLEPSAGPAPTMHSLEEIYNILDPFNKAPEDVCFGVTFLGVRDDGTIGERTGTKFCGAPFPTTTTTIFIPPLPSSTTTIPAATRFTYNGDGTVTDNLSGLIWLQDSSCFGEKDWPDSKLAAISLKSGDCGLTDNSEAGDWRLPTLDELNSLIDRSQYDPALPIAHPFVLHFNKVYWTSDLMAGPVPTDSAYWVWCVNVKNGTLVILFSGYNGETLGMCPVKDVVTVP